jgi:PAS domain S-box-containing protein
MSDPFRALFMASPVATAIASESDGRILLANPSWLELLGWEEDAVIGRTVEDIGFWARPERRAMIVEELRGTGPIRDLSEVIRTKSGETLTVLISVSVVEFEGERCLVGAFHDITEHRRQEGLLRESEAYFRQLTESVELGFLLRELDPPVILYASPGVERIYGIAHDAFCEDPTVFDTAIHPDDQSHVLAKRDAMTGPEDYEFRIVRPDGATRRLRARAAPVRNEDDGVARIAAVIDDVTEERALHAALSASDERFRMLVRSVTDYAIIGLDPEGHVVGWNPGAERIQGYHANEIIGRHFSVFYPPEQIEAGHPQRELEAAVAAGRYQEEGERVRKDGSRFWADVTLTPIRDDAGELRGFAKVMHDITERRAVERALQESEERFRVLAENSTDVITRASPDATLLYVSPASRTVYGYEPQELIGRSGRANIHPEDHAALLADLGGRADLTLEYRFRRKDGRYVWVETKTRTLRDPGTGAVLEYQSSTRDISERRLAEAAARGAQELAERANSAKSEFLSRMSHELRTPLHAILGFGELLGREDLSAGQREKIALLTRSGRYLLELINEVLDLSRIERGELRLSLEPVHLGEVVRETLNMVLPLAAARSITVLAPGAEDLDTHVLADRLRLKQVLLNLLSNAVKYNSEGGNVTVRATSAAPTARIEVTDTGIGIARDALLRVFEPFDRLGAEASEVDGAGLGLALSKRLMEAMEGEIGIDSSIGTGTTAWIELPVVAAPVAALRPPESEPTIPAGRIPNRSMTALYVEDNPSNIKLVETMLAARPEVTLLVATQGSLAIELAREHRPDLILLDLNLPDISGEEILLRLRSDARTAEIPVVITSADATATQIKRLRNAGAGDYLTKPFGVERLFAVIDAVAVAGADAQASPTAPAVLDHDAIAALHELASKPNVGAPAICQLVHTYLADALDRCAGIEQAVGASDLAEVKRQAHALGGASGWAGATEVLRRCRELEVRVERDDAEGVASVSAGLGQALAMARGALEAEFGG